MKLINKPRVVFDCNVLVQAIGSSTGPSAKCLRLLQDNQIEVFVSRPVLRELRAVMKYPSVRSKFPAIQDHQVAVFLDYLKFRGVYIRNVPHVFSYPRAVQDEPYIDLAATADAEYLVSWDADILSLAWDRLLIAKKFRKGFPRLNLVTPEGLLNALEKS